MPTIKSVAFNTVGDILFLMIGFVLLKRDSTLQLLVGFLYQLLRNEFVSQAIVSDDKKPQPLLELLECALKTIPITSKDVKAVLKNLKVEESCDPDLISHHLINESADTLA